MNVLSLEFIVKLQMFKYPLLTFLTKPTYLPFSVTRTFNGDRDTFLRHLSPIIRIVVSQEINLVEFIIICFVYDYTSKRDTPHYTLLDCTNKWARYILTLCE